MTGLRDLAVYTKVCALSDELHECVRLWETFDRWTVGVQAVRSADSVGANLAEARGRRGDKDRARFVFIARGSCLELQHWLERAAARKLPCPPDGLRRAQEVSRMLNGMAKAWIPKP